MLVARRWLNRGGDPKRPGKTRRNLMDFVRDYNLAPREHRVRIGADSPLVAETVVQVGAKNARCGEHRRYRAHEGRTARLA
jgi:hypothetical protein